MNLTAVLGAGPGGRGLETGRARWVPATPHPREGCDWARGLQDAPFSAPPPLGWPRGEPSEGTTMPPLRESAELSGAPGKRGAGRLGVGTLLGCRPQACGAGGRSRGPPQGAGHCSGAGLPEAETSQGARPKPQCPLQFGSRQVSWVDELLVSYSALTTRTCLPRRGDGGPSQRSAAALGAAGTPNPSGSRTPEAPCRAEPVPGAGAPAAPSRPRLPEAQP